MVASCGVCGLATADAVCPRCNTILLHGQAICPRCGKLFPGWTATCDVCGTSIAAPPGASDDEEAVRVLSSVPGVSRERARTLVARGFRDVSDVVRLALPEADVRRGLHHTIARHLLLSDVLPRPAEPHGADLCPVCGGPTNPGDARCGTCGSALSTRIPPSPSPLEMGDPAADLAAPEEDAEAGAMPDAIRRELLGALDALGYKDVLRDQYRRQVDAWRSKGFEVGEIESLLDNDLDGFRERSVPLIRAQVLARAGGGRCPLCDSGLPVAARMCENCGARVG